MRISLGSTVVTVTTEAELLALLLTLALQKQAA
jgi:hypothetical protein